ncbi:MAG TPA: bifunctional 2-polyprenyl-6-hydroxyphenol methylase/3-demethylubiquinol 3-O-methyltransferase UbiG [Alphaproteobacteria bacterium]|nr:bifunctional 2-polyprenyl-6-hydroxyphenol methylase/3-demethylubiquinol 3-O-methyltransferase UbiG [Alphaproteobacteria bacterium]
MPEAQKVKGAATSSSDPRELAQFARHGREWWDPEGPFAQLHRLNPARLDYIRQQAVRHFRPRNSDHPLQELCALDIGCGGGLVAEPLARMGADVLGIDLVPESIAAARAHAEGHGLDVEYRLASAQQITAEHRIFDLVTCLEVVEHVVHPAAFLENVCSLVRPGGLLVMSTLNRNAASLALGKIAAEYVLGWVPRGTHDWRKFLRPSELAAGLRRQGLKTTDVTGLNLHPLHGWQTGGPVVINYFLTAERPADG